jgi:hypothetical protein
MMHALETINKRALAIVAVLVVVIAVLVVALSQSDSTKPSAPVVTQAPATQPPVEANRRADAAAASDLRNGLTAEKVQYADTLRYTATTATLQQIEPLLHWNVAGGVQVFVGDVAAASLSVVCLQEISASGSILSIADIATGPKAGTYYNRATCSTDVATITRWTGW